MLENFFMNVAGVGKYFIPPSLRPRLREEYSYFVRAVFERRQLKDRTQFMKSKGTYLEWYAKESDDTETDHFSNEDNIGDKIDLLKTGTEQLTTAIKAGL